MKVLFTDDCIRKLVYDFYLMGQCAIQVIYSQDRTRIAELEHIPVETLRAEKSVDGEIEAYYYAKYSSNPADFLNTALKGYVKYIQDNPKFNSESYFFKKS